MNDDYHNKRQAMGAYNRAPENPRNVTDLACGQLVVTSTPQQVNLVSRLRKGTRLTNLSGTLVYFGPTSGVSSTTGDILEAGFGCWTVIPARSVIWVVCAVGSTALIAWSDVYDD